VHGMLLATSMDGGEQAQAWRQDEIDSRSVIPLHEECRNRSAKDLCSNPSRAAQAVGADDDNRRCIDKERPRISRQEGGL